MQSAFSVNAVALVENKPQANLNLKQLLEAFRPNNQIWEKRIIERGDTLFNHSYQYLLDS